MDVPPYSVVGSTRHGIVGDIALEAMRRSELLPRVIEVPNARALHDVPHLHDTLIIPLARLNEREAGFTWIARVITVERAFFTRGKKVKSFADAKDKFATVGVERGSAAHAILLSHGFSEDRLVDVTLDSLAAKMVRAGRIDAWFGVVRAGHHKSQPLPLQDLVVSSIAGTSTEQYLACSKACAPALVKRLSGAIHAMQADGSIGKIIETYESPPEP
jgi:polar amino acid transport system substrate-binding protein